MMANNEKNLVPMNRRTKEEQRRIASAGGRASGEARRAKKTMREYADFLLSLPVTDGRKFNKLSRLGIPLEEINNKMDVIVALVISTMRYLPLFSRGCIRHKGIAEHHR